MATTTEISINLLRTFRAWHGHWPMLRGPEAAFVDGLPIDHSEIERSLQQQLLQVHYPPIGTPCLRVPGFHPEPTKGPMPAEEHLRKDTLYVEFGNGNRLIDYPGGEERRLVTVAGWEPRDDFMMGGPGMRVISGPKTFEGLCKVVRSTSAQGIEFYVVEEPKRSKRR